MKTPRMAYAMSHIDDDLIALAAESKKKAKHSSWLKWGSIAACFAVLFMAGVTILKSLPEGDSKYKYQVSGVELDVEWPWEYKTNGEKYRVIDFNGTEYNIKYLNPIGAELLGGMLDTCIAEGVDSYTNEEYTDTLEIRKIKGVSEKVLVAAGNDSGYFVYRSVNSAKPETFGEVLDLYGLTQTLEFDDFTVCEGYDEKGYFSVNDDSYIWQILSECRDAELYDKVDSFDRSNRNYLTFAVTSDALGVNNSVVYISEDGYFATNIFDYSYIYFIGEDAAGKIISYAKSNCSESEFNPYALTVSGTLTEIGDGYVLVDDTVLCANKEDGTVYKIFTDDIRMRRCIECTDIKVGDTVAVKYDGTISDNNEVSGAYSMYKGTLIDGDMAVAE